MYVVVFSRSSLYVQTTPEAKALSAVDVAASATAPGGAPFDDFDLDSSQLGGTLTWDPPADVTSVAGYSLYVATSSVGAGRSQLGLVVTGTNELAGQWIVTQTQ